MPVSPFLLLLWATHPLTSSALSYSLARGDDSHSQFEFHIFKHFSSLASCCSENRLKYSPHSYGVPDNQHAKRDTCLSVFWSMTTFSFSQQKAGSTASCWSVHSFIHHYKMLIEKLMFTCWFCWNSRMGNQLQRNQTMIKWPVLQYRGYRSIFLHQMIEWKEISGHWTFPSLIFDSTLQTATARRTLDSLHSTQMSRTFKFFCLK